MVKWFKILLLSLFRRQMGQWYKTHKGDFFNLGKSQLLYVCRHNNPIEKFGVECREDYTGLFHVFADEEPVSRGYNTEEEAKDMLLKFMSNLNYYDVDFFVEN